MIELDSVFIVILIEVLAVLILMVVVFFVLSGKRRSEEHMAANKLIDKLEDSESERTKKLAAAITETCQIDPVRLKEILKEINELEQRLYHRVLQIFLKRDINQLKKLDQNVNDLSMPYCKILSASESFPDNHPEPDVTQIDQLKKENEKLSEQLQMAMHTMDEISAEYTRVFSGTQSELELENSSKKMMRIFADAEKAIRASCKEAESK